MKRLVAIAAVLLAAGCGTDGRPADGGDEISLTVFAAASLTETFSDIASEFERANPHVSVELNFAGSADLAAQLQQGAPADVFAAADETTMSRIVDAGLIARDIETFATNTLMIATAAANPGRITGLADLADPSRTIVVCAEQVPCGAATAKVAAAAGIEISADSQEQSVTDVMGKIRSAEADAGLVYVTDVAAARGEVVGIEFDESQAAVNRYPIGVMADSSFPDEAAAFADFVLGPVGQRILAAAGFVLP